MTSISNLVQPIVASYFYTDVYNNHNPDSKVVKGGFPVDNLIDMANDDFIMQGGGGSGGGKTPEVSRETLKKQFANYGVPVGLVYIKETCNVPNEMEYETYDNIPLANAIDEKTYDTLVDLISYSVSNRTPKNRGHKNKTRKMV